LTLSSGSSLTAVSPNRGRDRRFARISSGVPSTITRPSCIIVRGGDTERDIHVVSIR